MQAFIDKEQVLELLKREDVRFVDCRFNLGNSDEGESLYKEGHISGAVYFDLERDLSSSVGEHGGRHPLPDLQSFQSLLERVGIGKNTTVIAYDGGEGAFAARCWWLLKYVGHEKVFILDGGYKEWLEIGYPVDIEPPEYKRAHFEVNVQSDTLASMEDVKRAIEAKDHILIDSRAKERFLGLVEPIDKKAGHIPTACNYCWTEGFVNGKFKSPSEQKKRFASLDKNKPIIVYCGSGVTAAPNYIALKEAGFNKVKLYPGSFSDWISYNDNEVAALKENE